MNRIYRVVFNQTLHTWQVVSEIARGRTRSRRSAVDRPAHALSGTMDGGALRAIAVAAVLCLAGSPAAMAGAGGIGGQPTDPTIHGGNGGNDSAGGAGALNDSTVGATGGNGGAAAPGAPTAGSAAIPGTSGNAAGAGGAAGTSGATAGGAGQSLTAPNSLGGGGGGGYAGAEGIATTTTPLVGGAGGAGGAGYWAAGGGGAGGFGVVLNPGQSAFGNSSSITGGAGGAGGDAYSQGGGGGGGGTGIYVNMAPAGTAINTGTIVGGNGGAGGTGGVISGGTPNGPSGGGGGGGGNGATVVGGSLRNEAGASIIGGNGGAGGAGDASRNGGAAGAGGGGGDGVRVTGTGIQVFNAGTISGGNGGIGGANPAGVAGANGAAGVGLRMTGDGNTLINAGSITGGAGGNAATFTGNNNTLELQAGYGFTGNVVAAGTGNALVLGGTSNGGFDVSGIGSLYQGFSGYRQTGTGTWTLSGSSAATTPWSLLAGTTSIASDASLGNVAGGLTIDGGALQTTASISTARLVTLGAAGGTLRPDAGTTLALSGVVDGGGALTQSGPGTLTLSGNNTYSGGTLLNGGVLNANANAALGTGVLTVNGGTLGSATSAQLANAVVVNGDFAVNGDMALSGNMLLNTSARINGVNATERVVTLGGTISGAHGLTLDATGAASTEFAMSGSTANTYAGLTTVQGLARLALGKTGAQSIVGDLTVTGNAAVGITANEQISDSATVTVNSTGQPVTGVAAQYNGLQLATWGTPNLVETIGTLNGNGTVGLGSGTLRVGAGDFTGVISNGSIATFLASPAAVNGNLVKYGPGTLTLSGANSYTGSTSVDGGTLRAGAANTFSAGSALTVASGATLDLAGFSQSVPSLTNSGTVSLLGTTPGTVLTVTGPYVGNNGVLRLGTSLGNSASVSDRLLLSGATAVASGSTTVQVTNLGGLGAQTTGNGIEVISTANGGSIAANAFSLAGGHVDAGAYEYRLNTTATGGYLSSTTNVVPPTTPTTPTIPGVAVPTYRAEVPLLAALPEQLRQGNLAMLGNMHQRTGDDSAVAGAPATGDRQAWGRLITVDRTIGQSGTVSPASEGRVTGFQAGTDVWANAGWRAGLYVGQLEGDMRVSGFASGIQNLASGSNDLRSQYVGAYATYKNTTGFYADAVLQAGRHRYTAQPNLSPAVGGKGDSLLASIEVGQSFALAPNWSIEPQLQLVHQRIDLDDVALSGAQVRQDAEGGWLLRAGVRVKGEIATGLGLLQPYGRFNVYSSRKGTDVARFTGPAAYTDILTRTGGTSSELAAGATLALGPTTSLYGEIGKLWASGGNTRVKSGVSGSVGVKVRW